MYIYVYICILYHCIITNWFRRDGLIDFKSLELYSLHIVTKMLPPFIKWLRSCPEKFQKGFGLQKILILDYTLDYILFGKDTYKFLD